MDFHEGYFYLTEGGRDVGCRVVKVSKDGQNVQVLVEGLPRYGDHHTNGAVIGPDGWLYFAQGPTKNSAVVGLDNWKLGWFTDNEELHDIPCEDIVLTGHNYATRDPFSVSPGDSVVTGPYKPFGRKAEKGEVVVGQVPCTGAIMRVRPDGGPVELVASGYATPLALPLVLMGNCMPQKMATMPVGADQW